MLDLDRLNKAIVTLKKLNKVRGQLSRQLAALKARYNIRKDVVDNLYGYYEQVANDYFAVNDGILTTEEAIGIIRDYLEEHLDLLDDQLTTVREYLSKPVKPTHLKEKLDHIKSHVYYMKDDLPDSRQI